MNHYHTQSEPENVVALCRVAQLSNFLAKQLKGPTRTLAYRIKAEACSYLIIAGNASLNGIWPGGIVALDLFGDPPARLHIRRSHLRREAREILDQQTASVPAVARLGESINRRKN